MGAGKLGQLGTGRTVESCMEPKSVHIPNSATCFKVLANHVCLICILRCFAEDYKGVDVPCVLCERIGMSFAQETCWI